MEVPRADTQAHVAPEPPKQAPKNQKPAASRVPSIIVGLLVVAVAGLSIWYLVRGEPLLVQGEVDATRLDIAARVDGRVAEIPVERGQNVAAGAVLVKIDNPETLAKNEQALAAKVIAEAQLANIKVGTRGGLAAGCRARLGFPSKCVRNDCRGSLDRGAGRIGGIEKLEEFDELAAAVALPDERVDLASIPANRLSVPWRLYS